MSAGFGRNHYEIGNSLTWRQIHHYAAAISKQKQHQMADNIQSIALAINAKDLPAVLSELRNV